MSMKEQLEQIEVLAKEQLSQAQDAKTVEELRVKFLGKKGELTAILKQMGGLSAEERPVIGQLANKVRADIETARQSRKDSSRRKPSTLLCRARLLRLADFTHSTRLLKRLRKYSSVWALKSLKALRLKQTTIASRHSICQSTTLQEILRIHSISMRMSCSEHRHLLYR